MYHRNHILMYSTFLPVCTAIKHKSECLFKESCTDKSKVIQLINDNTTTKIRNRKNSDEMSRAAVCWSVLKT